MGGMTQISLKEDCCYFFPPSHAEIKKLIYVLVLILIILGNPLRRRRWFVFCSFQFQAQNLTPSFCSKKPSVFTCWQQSKSVFLKRLERLTNDSVCERTVTFQTSYRFHNIAVKWAFDLEIKSLLRITSLWLLACCIFNLWLGYIQQHLQLYNTLCIIIYLLCIFHRAFIL